MRGLSLIELMIAMLIASILMLGLVQIFSGSRAAYQLSEGLARTQENSRFAMDFLQRDIRMAGHFGCVNDQAHARNTPPGMNTTFAAVPHPALNYDISIRGFEANSTGPNDTLSVSADPEAGGDAYTPALPAGIAAAIPRRIAGSDIIALRFLAPEGVPITSISGTAGQPVFNFDPSRWDVLRSGVGDPGLFGVADCLNATVFQAKAVAAGSVTMGAAPNNAATTMTKAYTPGQSMLYRAESVVYYIGRNDFGRPSLYRLQYTAAPDGVLVTDNQELVEGIENLQLLYGQDRVIDPARSPTGHIDRQLVASGVESSQPAAADGWRRVGSVQIGLLAASPDPSSASQAETALAALGVTYTAPSDGRFRAVYQSTIAVRNRLYGN
ncbi:PilW family protein [Lysobacter sp. A421]